MTFFCPQCWREIQQTDERCPFCDADIKALEQRSFVQKLIAALYHPESETPIRAAMILGQLKAKEALPELLRLAKSSADPFIQTSAIKAIGEIGDASMVSELEQLPHSSLPIKARQAVRTALWKLKHPT